MVNPAGSAREPAGGFAASAVPQPVLITGINGFIAGHLAERLLSCGVVVRGLARRPGAAHWLAEQGVDVLQGNLLDEAAALRAVRGCGSVVHAAAWTGGSGLPENLAWRTNVEGTDLLLHAAELARVQRFVYLSSVAVYGLNRSPIIDESAPTRPVGQLYPDSKIAAESRVRAGTLPWVIVRPASTYGPRGTAWTLGPLEQIRQGRLILLGRDEGLVTPGYIDNVIDGLCLALSHPEADGGTFNLCDDRAVTYREFYLAYARMLGRTNLPTVPAWSARFTRFPPVTQLRRLLRRPTVGPWSLHFRRNPSQFSIERARRELGYQPEIGFEEGMRRTEEWLRRHGYLA